MTTPPRTNRPYGPATVTLRNLDCQADPLMPGMANLTAVIEVLRIDAETIENLQVIVNGFASAGIPVEQSGSPTTPNPGQKLHKYDWSDSAACNSTNQVQAVATVVIRTSAASSVETKNCPAC